MFLKKIIFGTTIAENLIEKFKNSTTDLYQMQYIPELWHSGIRYNRQLFKYFWYGMVLAAQNNSGMYWYWYTRTQIIWYPLVSGIISGMIGERGSESNCAWKTNS
jgi:hypothetical protein